MFVAIDQHMVKNEKSFWITDWNQVHTVIQKLLLIILAISQTILLHGVAHML